MRDLIIEEDYFLSGADAQAEHGTNYMQRIEGSYKDSGFIIDRVYDGEYIGDDGETYYSKYQWVYDVPAEDRDENEIDIMEIVDLYEKDEYDKI
jgi:hypothetical protein